MIPVGEVRRLRASEVTLGGDIGFRDVATAYREVATAYREGR